MVLSGRFLSVNPSSQDGSRDCRHSRQRDDAMMEERKLTTLSVALTWKRRHKATPQMQARNGPSQGRVAVTTSWLWPKRLTLHVGAPKMKENKWCIASVWAGKHTRLVVHQPLESSAYVEMKALKSFWKHGSAVRRNSHPALEDSPSGCGPRKSLFSCLDRGALVQL